MTRAGVADPARYLEWLTASEDALNDLLAELTIGETYFFREPAQFQFLRRVALPDLARRRGAGHTVRAWSAGCAMGEEAYSLAILFEEEGRADASYLLATALAVKLTIGIGTALAFVLVALTGFFVIRSITTPVRSAVTELTTASTEILAGTSQQAAAVSQRVATVDEVTQTAEQSAQRARGVGEAVQRSVEVGNNGKKAVEEALAAMATVRQQVEATAENILSLAEQAQSIGDIIATVNDLAEQTNLLALNAAIEASRAGEHGRGFAVVAGEVKALADQSKKATAQVRQILSEIQRATNTAVLSTEEVTKGVAKAIAVGGQAGETIRSLAETLAEVARTAAQIVASVGQQATGMSQIHQAIRNIDQVAKQNAVATRQTVQAADNLNKLGTRLAALTAQ